MNGDDPIIMMEGDKVALGPATRHMLPLIERWENDLELSVLSGDPARPVTREAIEADYERHNGGDRRDGAYFALYERATRRPIGMANLRDIDHAHRTAEFGISIGARDCWGNGYGTEVTVLLLDYAFNVLGLHNVWLDTTSFNERAIRAYTRAGFRIIGRRREAHRVGNRVYDVVLMDCVASEFRSPLRPVLELP